MNAVMAGMIPVMVALMGYDMRAMEPSSLRFWGVMSLATLVGAAVAYPVNVWLVAIGLKHGMGTVRALGGGGHTLAAEARRDPAVARAPDPSPAPIHAGMAGMGTAGPHSAHAVTPGSGDPTAGHAGMDMGERATPSQLAAVTLLTLLLLGAGVVLADLSGGFAPDAAMEHGPGMSMPMPAR